MARGGNCRLVQPMSKTFHHSDNLNLSGGGKDNLHHDIALHVEPPGFLGVHRSGFALNRDGSDWGDLCCNRLGLRRCRFTEVNALHGFVRLAKSAALRAKCSCSHAPSRRAAGTCSWRSKLPTDASTGPRFVALLGCCTSTPFGPPKEPVWTGFAMGIAGTVASKLGCRTGFGSGGAGISHCPFDARGSRSRNAHWSSNCRKRRIGDRYLRDRNPGNRLPHWRSIWRSGRNQGDRGISLVNEDRRLSGNRWIASRQSRRFGNAGAVGQETASRPLGQGHEVISVECHVYSEPSAVCCSALSRSIVLASSMEIGRGGMASCARSQRQVRYLLFSACSSRCL